jgi:hypothetical protein
MKSFYVEVFSPAWPNTKRRFRVWDEYPGSELSASLTHLYEVQAWDKDEAIASILAGEGRTLVAPDGKKLSLA